MPTIPAGVERAIPDFDVLETHVARTRDEVVASVVGHADRSRYVLRALPDLRVPHARLLPFRRLVGALRELQHPHLLVTHKILRRGSWVLVLRALGPQTDLLEAVDPHDPHRVVQVLTAATGALRAVHEAGLTHGIPKPSRLRVEVVSGRLEQVLLVDPCLHMLTGRIEHGRARPHWAPELRRGAKPTPRSDLYILGAGFLELLGGRSALYDRMAGGTQRFRDLRPDLDRGFCGLLDRLIASHPHDRPPDAGALWRDLHGSGWGLPARRPDLDRCMTARLVERDPQLERLARAMHQPFQQHAIEITGPPGCGRSRLLDAAGDRAAKAQWSVLRWTTGGAGDGLEELIEAAATAGGVPAPQPRWAAGQAAGPREHQAARMGTFVRAMQQIIDQLDDPLVLLIDDLDHRSPTTGAALQYLLAGLEAAAQPPTRFLVVTTSCEPAHLPGSACIAVASLEKSGTRRWLLPLLAEALNPEPLLDALQTASGGRPQWLRLILADWIASGRVTLTRGRPYFDASGGGGAPRALSELTGDLLAHMETAERTLVQLIATLGEPIALADLAAMVPDAPTLVRGTVAGALLEIDAGRVRCSARATRDAVLAQMTPEVLRERCAALAGQLLGRGATGGEAETGGGGAAATSREADGATAARPEVLGRILLGAGRVEEGVRTLLHAAGEAERSGDRWLAFACYREAFSHPDVVGAVAGDAGAGDDPLALRLRASRLASQLGERDWAQRLADDALEEAAPGEPCAPAVLLELANIARDCNHSERATALYRAARKAAAPSLAIEIDLEEAANAYAQHDYERAAELAGSAVEQRSRLHPVTSARALNRLATIRIRQGRWREAAGHLLRAYRIAVGAGQQLLTAQVLDTLGAAYTNAGRYDVAEKALTRARRILDRFPSDPRLAFNAACLGALRIHFSRGAEAERDYALTRAIRRRTLADAAGRAAEISATNGIGIALLQQGRIVAACETLHSAHLAATALGAPVAALIRANLGNAYLRYGELAAAEGQLRSAIRDRQLPVSQRGVALFNLGELLIRRRRLREAEHTLDRSGAILAAVESPFLGLTLARRAVVLLELGETEEALAAVDRADSCLAAFLGPRFATAVAAPATLVERFPPVILFHWMLARSSVAVDRVDDLLGPLDAILAAAASIVDPTLRAEILIEALERARSAARQEVTAVRAYQEWRQHRLAELEAISAATDSVYAQAFASTQLEPVAAPGRGAEPRPAAEPERGAEPRPLPRPPGGASLAAEIRLLRGLLAEHQPDPGRVAELVGAEDCLRQLARRASALQPALITGEPGTGLARMALIAHLTQGRQGVFLPVLCAAQPDAVLADDDGTVVPLAAARGGTVLLLDVERLSRRSMKTLLRAVQVVGRSNETWVVATRSLEPGAASTARPRGVVAQLLELLGEPITLPPVRDRVELMPLIIELLIADACRDDRRPLPRATNRFIQSCRRYRWPRNFDELRLAVYRAVELARRGVLGDPPIPRSASTVPPYREAEADFEHRILSYALRAAGGNVAIAAELLDLPLSTLRYKLRRFEGFAEEDRPGS